MPSNRLVHCHSLFLLPLIFPSIKVFSNESAVHIRWPNYWSFSFRICPSNEDSGLISFKVDWLDLLARDPRDSQESSLTLQFKNINSSVLNLLYGSVLTSIHDYWKNHNFDYMDLCQQIHVCFLMYCLGLSYLFFQSASIFYFDDCSRICSDFGTQENNVCHCFHCFSIYLP